MADKQYYVAKPVIKMKAGWVRVNADGTTTGPYPSRVAALKGGKVPSSRERKKALAEKKTNATKAEEAAAKAAEPKKKKGKK